jgi:hypothetical protein
MAGYIGLSATFNQIFIIYLLRPRETVHVFRRPETEAEGNNGGQARATKQNI